MTSRMPPRVARTSLLSAAGGNWKCIPRSVPLRRLKATFACAICVFSPCSANSCRQEARAEEPRLSSRRSGSMTKAPASFVSVNLILATLPLKCDPSSVHAILASRSPSPARSTRRSSPIPPLALAHSSPPLVTLRRMAAKVWRRSAAGVATRRTDDRKSLMERYMIDAAEAKARADRAAEEAERRLAAEAEARELAEKEERRRAAEAEARRLAEEEERRLAAEAEARRLAEEEEARRRAAEAEARPLPARGCAV